MNYEFLNWLILQSFIIDRIWTSMYTVRREYNSSSTSNY